MHYSIKIPPPAPEFNGTFENVTPEYAQRVKRGFQLTSKIDY